MQSEVIVYSSNLCGYCYRAKALLNSKHVEFSEIKVDGRFDLRQQMVQLTDNHTVPQVIINGQAIGGCDDLYALEERQQLDLLLNILD
jgi:glutaredoxin 3